MNIIGLVNRSSIKLANISIPTVDFANRSIIRLANRSTLDLSNMCVKGLVYRSTTNLATRSN